MKNTTSAQGVDHLEKLKARVTIGKDGCWLWQGLRDRDGYGRASFNGKQWQAHRLAYALAIGPIPAGMVLHHHCRNRQCCNPLHLDLCTPEENTMRGVSPPACNSRKVACDHGHSFDAANTYRHRQRRQCRPCNRAAVRRYKLRKGGAA